MNYNLFSKTLQTVLCLRSIIFFFKQMFCLFSWTQNLNVFGCFLNFHNCLTFHLITNLLLSTLIRTKSTNLKFNKTFYIKYRYFYNMRVLLCHCQYKLLSGKSNIEKIYVHYYFWFHSLNEIPVENKETV